MAETDADVPPAPPTEAPVASEDDGVDVSSTEGGGDAEGDGGSPSADDQPAPETEVEPAAAAVTTAVEDRPAPEGDGAVDGDGAGSGNGADGGNGAGKVAAVVSTRPTVPPKGTPEGVRSQRLLTVVKARAIQTVKAEPTDKVNTWPHLMLMEFGALDRKSVV